VLFNSAIQTGISDIIYCIWSLYTVIRNMWMKFHFIAGLVFMWDLRPSQLLLRTILRSGSDALKSGKSLEIFWRNVQSQSSGMKNKQSKLASCCLSSRVYSSSLKMEAVHTFRRNVSVLLLDYTASLFLLQLCGLCNDATAVPDLWGVTADLWWIIQHWGRGNQSNFKLLHSFINSSMALQPFVGPRPLLQFRNHFYTDGKTPWTSDQPVARPLPIHRTTQTQNKRAHRLSCLECDSNPRSQRPNERKQFMT
jgi:hypothetical protein